jgi:glycosyltransferase involved in cell wall biosynthesis
VVEAAAHGTPSVVVRGPDNAATELIEEGINGVVAASASAPDLASAILRVYEAGPALRRSTAAWFARNAELLSLAGSLDQVSAAYRD